MKEECLYCGGQGWYEVPGHDPRCQGDCLNCPIPLQELCDNCSGTGEIDIIDPPAPPNDAKESQ